LPSVVPSQIVEYIDATFPYFNTPTPQGVGISPSICAALSALLRLIEELPNALLPSDPQTYSEFIRSQEHIRYVIQKAQCQTATPLLTPDTGKPSQVQIIRNALHSCHHEVPPRNSKELAFINDSEFRRTLLVDLEAARSALNNGEWKAATVLGGSLVESLLLWAIQNQEPSKIQGAFAARKLRNKSPDPLDWGLHEYVEVAEELGLVESETAKQTRLAKDFRNLIHPGRTVRLQQSCDRGSALAASAAVELVSRDLSSRAFLSGEW
jgi:hypothetical protein